MIDSTFVLNNAPLSTFTMSGTDYPAFSGDGKDVNKPGSQCLLDAGPIPIGTYYIVDRESGGLLGPLIDKYRGRDQWFALYANDGAIDDKTYCDAVERGQFRLHPKGTLGVSTGCIVINDPTQFFQIRSILRATQVTQIPGTKYVAYGTVRVI